MTTPDATPSDSVPSGSTGAGSPRAAETGDADHRSDPDDEPVVSDDEPDDDVTISRAARTFVLLATTASIAAFDLGFDLGAFENVDHRKQWAVWVLSFVALAANFLIRDSDYRISGAWQFALALPTVWLAIDAFTDTGDSPIVIVAFIAALVGLPFALYVLARLMFGDYFRLTVRLRIAVALLVGLMAAAGWLAGHEHPRFMTCDDFARAGEFIPENCRP